MLKRKNSKFESGLYKECESKYEFSATFIRSVGILFDFVKNKFLIIRILTTTFTLKYLFFIIIRQILSPFSKNREESATMNLGLHVGKKIFLFPVYVLSENFVPHTSQFPFYNFEIFLTKLKKGKHRV